MAEKWTNEELDQRVQELEQKIDRFKQIEKISKQNQIEFDALFNKSPLVMFIVDRDHRVCKLNAAAVIMTRRIEEDAIGLRAGEALRCVNSFDDPRGCGFSEACKSCIVRNTVLDTFQTGQEYQSVEAAMPYSAENESVILQVLVSTIFLKLPQGDRVLVCIEDITERARAQDALRESKKRFLLLSESLVDTVYEFDPKGRFTYVNEAGVHLFGYSKDELFRDIQVKDTISKEDHVRSKEDIGDIFKGKVIVGERTFLRKDGTAFIGEVHSGPIYKGKNVIGVRGVIRDITERKQAEETLKKNEERLTEANQLLSGVLEHTHMMAAYLDSRFDFIWVNHAYAAADNQEPSFFSDKNHFDLYPNEENQAIFQQVVDTGEPFFVSAKPFEYPGHSERGVSYWNWSLIPVKDETGMVSGLVFTLAEVTERIRAEEALRESEELLSAIFDAAKDSIFIKDSELKYKKINPAMERLFDKHQEEIIGKTDGDLFGKKIAKNLMEVDKRVLKGETLEEFPTKPTNGVMRSFHTIKVPLTNSNGEITGLCGIARDITEHKLAEEEKIEAQKIAGEQKKLVLIGQVAGKMAHDFNNILGIIMGNAELSLLDCKDAETIKTLELIFEQTLRGKNLTKNLIAFAKSQEPKQEFFRINEKIDLVLNLMKKDLEGISIIKDDESNVPDLLADPGMIEHAFVNLVQNSIHATSMVAQPKIIIRTFHKDKNIYLEIEDNGCGIPEEALDRIYEPAFTLKGSSDITNSYKPGIKGTGYGMANVKKYIEQHKGNILIDSKVGKGTKFIISLPVMKKELTQKEIIEIQKENFYFEKYILVVEDEQAISDVQYKILTHEPCNHKVDIAANGQMAIDLFDRNKYDFVSLDYILPGEFNGMDVYKHIRQTNDTLPILFVSGNLDFLESIKELKQKDPCVDHVSKPCQNKDYVNAINELLEKT